MEISNHDKGRQTYRFLWILVLFIVVSVVVASVVYPQDSSALDSGMVLEQTVDLASPKPGGKVNFNISYANPTSSTAYNVTIFEWIPSGLIFVKSKPFYDGVSNPEEGFLRWSRGNVAPSGGGTINVSFIVDNVLNGTYITNTIHLTYECENGTTVEVTSSVSIIVAHGAGVHVYPDQIHGIQPATSSETSYNITVSNRGNAPDVFNISLSSLAFDPTPAGKKWKIQLYNETEYLVATLFDEASDNHSSWTNWGTLTIVSLENNASTRFTIQVVEPGGTSGSGDAYIKVRLIATSQFDPNISDTAETITVVRRAVGISIAPDYAKEANPSETVTFVHEVYNGGGWKCSNQAEVVDLNYTSSRGWIYSFYFANGTALRDTDNSGWVDVGMLAKDEGLNMLVKVTVPYGTAAGVTDYAVITAKGVASGRFDTAKDNTTVKSAPLIEVVKELVTANPTYVGEMVTYRINVTNLGNTKLVRIPLDDAFETNTIDFSSASPSPDSYSEIAGTIHWENLTSLEPLQNKIVTVNFVATAGGNSVRESANVIDAEDQFGNLVSAVYLNTELKIVRLFTLTVTASPPEALGGTFDITWTERGVICSATFTTPKNIACDENTNATLSNPQEHIFNGDIRYVFDNYSVPSPTITIESDMTVVLNYRTQYCVTFTHTGLDDTATGTVVTVGGEQKNFADLPFTTDWLDYGTSLTFEYSNIVDSSISGKRFRLDSTTGPTSQITVTVSTTVTGNYVTQYLITFNHVGLDTSAIGTVVTVDGSNKTYGGLPFSKWVDKDDTVTYSYGPIVWSSDTGKRFRLNSVTGPGFQFTVTEPVTVTGNYVTQYLVTFAQTGLDKTATDTTLTVDGDTKEFNNLPFAVWIDSGGSIAYSYSDMVSSSISGKRCVLVNVTGSASPITVTEPCTVTGNYKTQYYLLMNTNLGTVAPGSGWHDAGSTIQVSAYAPSVVEGKGYVWYGWSGIGEVSYSGLDNPASITFNSPIIETAQWKILPELTIFVSEETIARCDRIVVYGTTLPTSPSTEVTITYTFPNGTQITHTVQTDEEGRYNDTLLLEEEALYELFAQNGQWGITASRVGDVNQEATISSTTLEIAAPGLSQIPPVVIALLIAIVVAISYLIIEKRMNGKKLPYKTWWRATVVLGLTGLAFAAASLAMNWLSVAGTANTNGQTYLVNINLHPLSPGSVSIPELQYIGAEIPSLIDSAWFSIPKSPGSVVTLYLVPVGCVLAVSSLYKPRTERQRTIKVLTLVIAGALILIPVAQSFMFLQAHASTTTGASIGYGIGLYIGMIGGVLVLLSSLFAARGTSTGMKQASVN